MGKSKGLWKMSPGLYRHYRDAEEECEKWSKICLEEKLAEKCLHLCRNAYPNPGNKGSQRNQWEKDTLQSSYKKARTDFYWSTRWFTVCCNSDAQYSDSIFLQVILHLNLY